MIILMKPDQIFCSFSLNQNLRHVFTAAIIQIGAQFPIIYTVFVIKSAQEQTAVGSVACKCTKVEPKWIDGVSLDRRTDLCNPFGSAAGKL